MSGPGGSPSPAPATAAVVVGEMVDSTASADDAEALQARLLEDGYVLVRGVIARDFLDGLERQVAATLQEHGWLEPEGPATQARPAAPAFTGGGAPAADFHWRGSAAVLGLEDYNRLPFQDGLQRLMVALLGEDAFPYPAKALHFTWPEAMGGRPTGPHTDALYGRWAPDMLLAWVALGDVPVELGGLAVLPGSHQVPGRGTRGFQAKATDPRERRRALTVDERWLSTSYRSGDVVVFHCLTVHASLPNRTDRLRLSTTSRWSCVSDPFPAMFAQPMNHPRVPGWGVLAEGWSTRRWIELPPGVKVADDPLVGWVLPSRYAPGRQGERQRRRSPR